MVLCLATTMRLRCFLLIPISERILIFYSNSKKRNKNMNVSMGQPTINDQNVTAWCCGAYAVKRNSIHDEWASAVFIITVQIDRMNTTSFISTHTHTSNEPTASCGIAMVVVRTYVCTKDTCEHSEITTSMCAYVEWIRCRTGFIFLVLFDRLFLKMARPNHRLQVKPWQCAEERTSVLKRIHTNTLKAGSQ